VGSYAPTGAVQEGKYNPTARAFHRMTYRSVRVQPSRRKRRDPRRCARRALRPDLQSPTGAGRSTGMVRKA
jgi:hypothetical protein